MTTFFSSAERTDPYRNFKFRVKWDGRYVAGVSRISALTRTTEVIEAREGSDPTAVRRLPGPTRYDPITLERGVSDDRAFEQWASQVSAGASAPAGYRKDIVLELFDETGKLVLAYNVRGCWVSEYQALPEVDANARGVLLEHITLENEGWERDTSRLDAAAPES